MRDLTAFYSRAYKAMAGAAEEAGAAATPENALAAFTRTARETLGHREKALEAGNLKEGEKDQYACGAFFVLEGGTEQILLAPQNYHSDQRHMVIGTDVGHPAWVVANRRPLLLTNTDHHQSFVKILRTFRGGSVVYAPVEWKGVFLGQIICAAQARNVMEEADLEVCVALANLAAAFWVAHGGLEALADIHREARSHQTENADARANH